MLHGVTSLMSIGMLNITSYSNLFHARLKKLGQNVTNNQFVQNLEEISSFKLLLLSASKNI